MGDTRKRLFFAGLGCSATPPSPTALTFLTFPARARIDFDSPLQTGVLDEAYWVAKRAGKNWLGNTVRAFSDHVIVTRGSDESTFDPDQVRYFDTVQELKGANGVPVAAFTVYP